MPRRPRACPANTCFHRGLWGGSGGHPTKILFPNHKVASTLETFANWLSAIRLLLLECLSLRLWCWGLHAGWITMSMKIGIRAWIDFAFRKIFGKPGNEICLISLLNAVLQFPYPVVSVEYLNPFGLKDFETDKLVCVDVKATDQRGRVFVIEVQIVVQSSFAKRAVFYACEAYTDQLRVGQGYSDLKATYSICLLMRNLWDNDQLHHQFQLVDRESIGGFDRDSHGRACQVQWSGERCKQCERPRAVGLLD